MTLSIACVLQVKLTGTGQQRTSRTGTASIEAHDCLLRGLERFWMFTPDTVEEAR